MDMKKLNAQIARLLNECNEYKCNFIGMDDGVYSMTTGEKKVSYDLIDPAIYLESVKAERYEA